MPLGVGGNKKQNFVAVDGGRNQWMVRSPSAQFAIELLKPMQRFGTCLVEVGERILPALKPIRGPDFVRRLDSLLTIGGTLRKDGFPGQVGPCSVATLGPSQTVQKVALRNGHVLDALQNRPPTVPWNSPCEGIVHTVQLGVQCTTAYFQAIQQSRFD